MVVSDQTTPTKTIADGRAEIKLVGEDDPLVYENITVLSSGWVRCETIEKWPGDDEKDTVETTDLYPPHRIELITDYDTNAGERGRYT